MLKVNFFSSLVFILHLLLLNFFSVFPIFFIVLFIFQLVLFLSNGFSLFNQQLTLPLPLSARLTTHSPTVPAQRSRPLPSLFPLYHPQRTSDSCTSVEHIIPRWPNRKSCADSTCILYVDLLHLYISSYGDCTNIRGMAHSFEITAWHRFQKWFGNWESWEYTERYSERVKERVECGERVTLSVAVS